MRDAQVSTPQAPRTTPELCVLRKRRTHRWSGMSQAVRVTGHAQVDAQVHEQVRQLRPAASASARPVGATALPARPSRVNSNLEAAARQPRHGPGRIALAARLIALAPRGSGTPFPKTALVSCQIDTIPSPSPPSDESTDPDPTSLSFVMGPESSRIRERDGRDENHGTARRTCAAIQRARFRAALARLSPVGRTQRHPAAVRNPLDGARKCLSILPARAELLIDKRLVIPGETTQGAQRHAGTSACSRRLPPPDTAPAPRRDAPFHHPNVAGRPRAGPEPSYCVLRGAA